VDSLSGLNPETEAIRIGGTVGMKARMKIQAAALEQGLKILNPRESGVKEAEPAVEEAPEEVTADE
jgi:large subunit ribosomal protein L32e